MRLKTERKLKKVLGLFLAFSIMVPYLTSGVVAQATPTTAILNNGKLKVGDASSASINEKGTLNQPSYYDTNSSTWYELTLGNYPMSYAIGAGGDGTSEWNINGSIVSDLSMTDQVIDTSAYVAQSASQGYGTIVSTGDVTVGGKIFEIKNTYSLESDKSFIKATTKITNKSGSNATNVRFWVGVPDDCIAGSDVNTKVKGNVVNGVFTPIANMADKASTLEVSSSGTAVLFFTNKANANTVVSYLGMPSLYSQDPALTPITQTGDNSYGIYTRLNDLANNESDDFTWYYAAGDVASIASIANQVNQAAEETVTTPSAVEISRSDDTLTAQLKNGDGSDFTTGSAVTYDWYRDGQSVQSGTGNTYTIGNADKDTNITVQVDQYNLESNSIYIPGDNSVTTPSAVVISKDDDTLRAQLKADDGSDYYTTGAAVVYDWYRGSEEIQSGTSSEYSITDADMGKYIVVKVDQYGLESDPYYVEENVIASGCVILAQGSLGQAGDTKITGLSSGYYYKVIVNGKNYYVTKNGQLSESISSCGRLVGTEITGLTNGTTYKVQVVNTASSSNRNSNSDNTSSSTKNQDNNNTKNGSSNDQNKNNNPVNNQNGKTGWVQGNDGSWNFVQDAGNKATGWNMVGGNWYFFNNSGKMETGWYGAQSGDWAYNGQDTQGLWFHLDADGKLTTGWYKDDTGNWYFLCDGSQYGALGVMMTGWQQVDGKWYYFNDNGAMASDATVDGYTLGSDGALVE